ncbi:DUF6130 family protein [Cupriavidus necator]
MASDTFPYNITTTVGWRVMKCGDYPQTARDRPAWPAHRGNPFAKKDHVMRPNLKCLSAAAIAATFCVSASAQTAQDAVRPPAILPLSGEPAPRLIAYPALAEPLARGVVIVQFRTENFRVMPVFGKPAVDISPRIGHLHVTVDDVRGTWAHTSEDPIIVVGLTPGPHKLRLELADPSHKILATEVVAVTVPDLRVSKPHEH